MVRSTPVSSSSGMAACCEVNAARISRPTRWMLATASPKNSAPVTGEVSYSTSAATGRASAYFWATKPPWEWPSTATGPASR